MSFTEAQKLEFSEQDTATKLVLPTLHARFGFPEPTSGEYIEQRTIPRTGTTPGRYDGMYSFGGYPIAILEVKAYSHQVLTNEDSRQARDYAISPRFTIPLPYLIMSNGKQYRFYARTEELDTDSKPKYAPVSQRFWDEIKDRNQGEEVQFIDVDELVRKFVKFQKDIFNDLNGFVYDASSGCYDVRRLPPIQREALRKVVESREKYIKKTEGSGKQKEDRQIRYALNSIALHFLVKVLFIKIIEDISDSSGLPKVLKRLFPRAEFDHIGGIFAYRILDKLSDHQRFRILRSLKKAFGDMNKLLASLTWEDIFRYGFKIHSRRFGELLVAKHYDSFYPSNQLLEAMRNELIKIDLGYILSNGTKRNFVGELYEKLIDESLKKALGTYYTPDEIVEFMVRLSKRELGGFFGKKCLEPACGSGHFYKRLYREYIDEVIAAQEAAGQPENLLVAHKTALDHIFGRDIDPFATQLTLLAVFLEQFKDNISVEDMTTGGRHWLPDYSIDCMDSIDPDTLAQITMGFIRTTRLRNGRSEQLTKSHAKTIGSNLIIGNPPYGIKVADEIKRAYELGSGDSYGVFIDNSIRKLPDGGHLVFIVSSSFLTLGTHQMLRRRIFDRCKVKRVFKLHRSTFPGIDVFPVIIELQKCDREDERDQNVYQFYDLWQIHPSKNRNELKEAFEFVLGDLNASSPWPFDRKRCARYLVRQGYIRELREERPIFDADTRIFSLLDNRSANNKCQITLDGKSLEARRVAMPSGDVTIIPLKAIAVIKQGLITGNNDKYIRRNHQIPLGEGQKEYSNINPGNILTRVQTTNLSEQERSHGIVVNNPHTDRYFIPYDKGGSSDILGQVLNNYHSQDEFYLDWSKTSVTEIQQSRSARFQNSQYYFCKGITYSTTGIYSPTFRLGAGTVFDAKGSTIFSENFSREFFLGILCSKLAKYILKSYLQHTVDMHEGPLAEFPLVIPSVDERTSIEDSVKQILLRQQENACYDYREEQDDIDNQVFRLYRLSQDLIAEVNEWYDRRYPKLRRDIGPESQQDSI